MRRLVIDTNVYVDWINHARHDEIVFQDGAVKYLSGVVLLELRAGALSMLDRRALSRLQHDFERAGRVLTPTRSVFAESGDVLRLLRARRGHTLEGGHSVVNDVLIAMSARSIGATVVTQNERDYRAIQAVRPFPLVIVPSG